MRVRNWLRWMVSLAVLACCGPLLAVPWSKAKRPEAETRKSFDLVEDNGPWMIMAATFAGEGAEAQARELVDELRTKHKVTAYLYQKQFDFSKEVQGRGIDRYGGPQSMRYNRDELLTEIAVLVGDYPDVSDPRAQKELKKLKYLRPAALNKENSAQTLATLRALQRPKQGEDAKKKGPMSGAFITTNPLLPKDYYAPKGIDKLVLDMNKDVKNSLLNCPGRYSVKVATFTGQVVLSQKIIEKIENGSNIKSRLAEAAEKAHKLTEALRSKGVPAYEFHDRYQSIVTVGSFNSVGNRREDGKIEINPAIHEIIQKYGADTKVVPGQATPQIGKPKSEGAIPFDISPVPVEVPRRSIAADYSRTADGR